jgi:hypothetical protein
MTTYVQYQYELSDGRGIVLPPWVNAQGGYANLLPPNIYEFDTIQKYPLGTKLKAGDCVWHYCRSGGITNMDLLVKAGLRQYHAYNTIAADADAGDTTVVIDVAAGDGPAADGEIAVNALAGGWIVIFPHDDNAFTRQILSNTAVAAGGGEMTLELTDPIPYDLDVDADHGECAPSIWYGVHTANDTVSSVMGAAEVLAASGTFLWLKTWGPHWISPQAAISVGNNNRQVVARHDGSLDEHDYNDADVTLAQHVGFVLFNDPAGAQAAPFVMLQICP